MLDSVLTIPQRVKQSESYNQVPRLRRKGAEYEGKAGSRKANKHELPTILWICRTESRGQTGSTLTGCEAGSAKQQLTDQKQFQAYTAARSDWGMARMAIS